MSVTPNVCGEKKPLDLLPVPDEGDVSEASKTGIMAIDYFEDILDDDQLSVIEGKIQALEKALREAVSNKALIDNKASEQKKHIRGLDSKRSNCKGKNKKTSQQRQSYLAQIDLENKLVEELKKQSDDLKALISLMESKMSSFEDEKLSIEEKSKL